VLDHVVGKQPKNYALQIMLSVAYRGEQQWDKAVQAARDAMKADPKKMAPYQAVLDVYLETGKPNDARRTLDQAAKQNVDDYRYWVQLGELYILLRERESSLEILPEVITAQYEKALKLNPDEPEVLVRMADHFLYTKNRYER